jgi:hypothetical protein
MKTQNRLQETFRAFVNQASQPGADATFLEELRKLTGQPTVADMIRHFQKHANIKPVVEVKPPEAK